MSGGLVLKIVALDKHRVREITAFPALHGDIADIHIGGDPKELGHFPLGLPRSEQLMGVGDLVGRERPGPADMQAILTVIGRRETTGKNRGNAPLDLSNTQLIGADLTRADLTEAEHLTAKQPRDVRAWTPQERPAVHV